MSNVAERDRPLPAPCGIEAPSTPGVARPQVRIVSALRALAAVTLLTFGAYTVVTTCVGVRRTFLPVPFWDQWNGSLGFYLRLQDDGLREFWSQHNEHRLVIPRLVFWADLRWFGGRNVFALVAGLVILAALCVALGHLVFRQVAKGSAARAASAGLIAALGFSWVQEQNLTWGFQSQWFFVCLFAVVAFDLLSSAAEAGRGTSWPRLVGALLAGTCSALSMASGLTVLPILVLLAWYFSLSRARTAVLAAGTVVVWFAYFHGYTRPKAHASLLDSLLHHPRGMALFVGRYLGSPAYHVTHQVATMYVAGTLVAAGGLAALVFAATARLRGRRHRVRGAGLLAVLVFTFGSAVMTAGGRLNFGLTQAVASRYSTLALLCWMSVLFFWAGNLRLRVVRVSAAWVAVPLAVLMAFGQYDALHPDHGKLFGRRLAGLALSQGYYDRRVTRAVYPFPERIFSTADEAKARRLSILSPTNHDYVRHPARIVPHGTCAGVIERFGRMEQPRTYLLVGWVYDQRAHAVPASLAVVDPRGNTVGTAIAGRPRPEIAAAHHLDTDLVGWMGFFRGNVRTVRIYARTASGDYCALTGSKRMPRSLLNSSSTGS